MTIEEKIEHFREACLEYAKHESYGELARYTQGLDRILKEHKETERAHMAQNVQAELTEARQLSNRELAKEQTACKRRLSRCEEELTEQLVKEIGEILEKAKHRPEYRQQLIGQMKAAVEYAAGEPVVIEIDASDRDLLPALQKEAAGRTVTVRLAEEEIGGGTRAEIASRNIRIDNSFLGRFEEVREDFRLANVL